MRKAQLLGRGLVVPVALFVILALLAILGPSPSAYADDDEVRLRARLRGFEETPAVSTAASGRFRGEITGGGTVIDFELSYSGLEANALFAHIHFGQRGVAGGVSAFFCGGGSKPAACPARSGTVTGTIVAADVIGPTGQGIAAGEFAELVRAIRAGVTYANVHSTMFPSGEIRGQIKAHDDD